MRKKLLELLTNQVLMCMLCICCIVAALVLMTIYFYFCTGNRVVWHLIFVFITLSWFFKAWGEYRKDSIWRTCAAIFFSVVTIAHVGALIYLLIR